MRYHEPEIGRAAVAVLEAAGFEVRLPRGRRCCGRPAFSAGNLDEVRKSAETIQSSSGKILERVRIDREGLEKQVTLLRDKVGELRSSMNAPQ